MRRLSHALGGVGLFSWLCLFIYEMMTKSFYGGVVKAIQVGLILAVGGAVCYGVPYAAVRLVDWVWAGFQED